MNSQRMLDLIHANEEAVCFNLLHWIDECGTYGCLVGNYEIKYDRFTSLSYMNSRIKDSFLPTMHEVSEHFDISFNAAYFLFNSLEWKKPPHKTRDLRNKEAALTRVRKYWYYKQHKKEMELDERYGIREDARRMGSWDLLERVKKSVELASV